MDEPTLRNLAQLAMADQPYFLSIFPPSPYYRFLKRLAEYMQPHFSVELGVCGGGGSLHLALGNPKGRVVGVDITYDHDEQIKHIYEVCPNFFFWLGDSVEDAPKIVSDFGLVDILFIDTTHTYEQTLAEFEAWYPYLSDKAVVCLDDLFRVEMRDIWDVLPGNKIRMDTLHDGAESGGGFGVIWK